MQRIGIDIIEIERIERAIIRWGDSFLRRIYTDAEISAYGSRPPSLAARFAGKEAVMKLLGSKGPGWREIEILSRPEGEPYVQLYGRAQSEAGRLGFKEIAISLSHSKEYAIASVAAVSAPKSH
ncbi:MAG: holo-ACP synthase [Dehalococcoidales bacterium]|nr:holo-ACP synthase [Dehalococcoidales bacterium]